MCLARKLWGRLGRVLPLELPLLFVRLASFGASLLDCFDSRLRVLNNSSVVVEIIQMLTLLQQPLERHRVHSHLTFYLCQQLGPDVLVSL